MKNRVFVFIDGSNFYHKLKELAPKTKDKIFLLSFDFRSFAERLIKPGKMAEIHYYIGAVKQEKNNLKSQKLYADQQKLLRHLQFQKIIFTLGQIIRHPDKTYHEKGVDVRLAVEMIRFARLDKYDTAYLISSDTDLVPAVEEVRSFGKKVCYVGTAKGQSFGLSKTANDVRLLRPEEIKQFFIKS